jgi:hypothetical protein
VSTARSGIHPELERVANALLKQSLAGVTSMSEKSDILTPWKEQDRRGREVYAESGTPDAATRRGMYHRAWNSGSGQEHLNSRDGQARGRRGISSLRTFVEEHGCAPGDEADQV